MGTRKEHQWPMGAIGSLLSLLDRTFPMALGAALHDFLATHLDVMATRVYVADYDLKRLRLWDERNESALLSLSVEDSDQGRAFLSRGPAVTRHDRGVDVHLPITVRAERLGVLSVTVPGLPDGAALAALQQATTILGYVVITAGAYTDTIERARREQPLSLPAELQWNQLPVRAYGCEAFRVAGQLAPAYEVGGDLFDYTVNPNELTISVTDAMGHGLQASMLGMLANGAVRNARRTGLCLTDQMHAADVVLQTEYGGDKFVAALGLSIDLESGLVTAVNAGYPPPFLIRDRHLDRVTLSAQLPLGLFADTHYTEQAFQLHRGDRLVLLSDGVLDAPDHRDHTPYGEERVHGALLATANLAPEEAVRRLVQLVSDHQAGQLRDDCTVLILDWSAGQPSMLAQEIIH